MTSDKKPARKPSMAASAYLILYNVGQCIGWATLLFTLVKHWFLHDTHVGMYTAVRPLLNVFQTAAVLEILHAAVGVVKTNPVLTAFQVFSRVFITWAVTYSVPDVQNNISVPMFLFAWAVTEVIRYSFYAFGILGSIPYPLVWLRYTLFIILYPIGVVGELMTAYNAIPYVAKTGMYSAPMPNPANISFNFHYFMYFFMLGYIPVFPQLYFHMFGQRRKIIGGEGRQKSE